MSIATELSKLVNVFRDWPHPIKDVVYTIDCTIEVGDGDALEIKDVTVSRNISDEDFAQIIDDTSLKFYVNVSGKFEAAMLPRPILFNFYMIPIHTTYTNEIAPIRQSNVVMVREDLILAQADFEFEIQDAVGPDTSGLSVIYSKASFVTPNS